MAPKALPSPEVLRQLLRYEPETGKLFWRERSDKFCVTAQEAKRWAARYDGAEAFTLANDRGYRCGKVFGRAYKAHRVIWAIVTGHWPDAEIDHRNGARDDNRFENLREASRQENCRNTRSRAGSSSRFLGVSWDARDAKWRSSIQTDGGLICLGYFSDEIAAAKAYDDAARRHYGAFANPNFTEPTRLCGENSGVRGCG